MRFLTLIGFASAVASVPALAESEKASPVDRFVHICGTGETKGVETLPGKDVSAKDAPSYFQRDLARSGDNHRVTEIGGEFAMRAVMNSTMGAIMAFVRFCHKREWIDRVPELESLDVDDVMKGRPITEDEFQRMLDATEAVVGRNVAESWKLAFGSNDAEFSFRFEVSEIVSKLACCQAQVHY